MTKAERREHLIKVLRESGFVDPVDGTVPIWVEGKRQSTKMVWVGAGQMVDVILANLPDA